MKVIKYLVAGVLGVLLFALSWSGQYLWWFSEDVAYAVGTSMVNSFVEASVAKRLEAAVQVDSADDLERKLFDHGDDDEDVSFHSFTAYYVFPESGERVYIEVATDWENPGVMTPAQKAAFQTFLNNFPSRRADIIDFGLVEYMEKRAEVEKEKTDPSARTRATTFGPVVLPAKLTKEDLAPGKCLLYLVIHTQESENLAYTTISFKARQNVYSIVECPMHGVMQMTQADFMKIIWGDMGFWGEEGDDEEMDDFDAFEDNRMELLDRIDSVRGRKR